MNLLIFLVSVFFSGVFYFFYLISESKSFFGYHFNSYTYFESLSGNLIIESIVFIIIGILLYLYFSDFSIKKTYDKKGKLEKTKNIDFSFILPKIGFFLKKYIYYIGFIFLYLGIYFIYKSLEFENFSIIIFIVNIIFFLLFFISHKFFIFRDFIKINTILFSVYYLVFYIFNFYFDKFSFSFLDIINSLFVLSSFLLVFYNDRKILKEKKLDNVMLYYFFIFLFSLISYSIWGIFDNYNISFILFIVGSFISLISYFYFTKISFLKNNIISLRIISLVFSYFSIIFGFYYFLNYGFNFIISTILIYFIFFLYDTHTKFQNYISFFFANLIFIFLIYYTYFKSFLGIDDGIIFLILTFIISLEAIILTYFYDFKYDFDYYFFHFFSYIINFISIIFFFIYFKIDLFTIGIIFFVESFYVFLSYYRLRQINLKF